MEVKVTFYAIRPMDVHAENTTQLKKDLQHIITLINLSNRLEKKIC